METSTYSPPFSGKLRMDNCLKLSFPNETTLQQTINSQGQEPDADNLLRQAIRDLAGEHKIPIAYDINAVTPYPDLLEFALFASKAYQDTEEKMLPMPDGWKLIATAVNTSWTNGYLGVAFMHPERHQIVIAHRGTKPLVLGAVLADAIGVIFNKMPSQMGSACTFCTKICSIAAEIGEQLKMRFQTFFTGHSLGGWLAQITCFCVKYLDIIDSNFQRAKSHTSSIHVKTIAFDSPGCKPMLLEMQDTFDIRYDSSHSSSRLEALDITTYLSSPNLVNTCNAHVGTLHRIEMDFSNMSNLDKFTLTYTFATHAMKKIVDSLQSNKNNGIYFYANEDWPIFNRRGNKKITKCYRCLLAPFKSCCPKRTISEDEFGYEWENFFRYATNENNYNPEFQSAEFQEQIQKTHGYWPIRYQTKPADNERCNINVFTPSEQQFLTTYFNLRTIRGTFQNNSFVDVPDRGDQEMIRHNLDSFKIDKNHIICDNLHLFIPYVQQLLYWHRPIIDATKAQISEYRLKKQWYDAENRRFLNSLESLHLDFRENIEMEFNGHHKVWHVVVKQSEDMRTMTAKLYSQCSNNDIEKTDCTLLKLKQLLFIDEQYVSLKSYLGSEEMAKHLFIIECQHSSSSLEPACKLLASIFSELEGKEDVRFIFITKDDESFSELLLAQCKTKLDKAFLTTDVTGTIWNDLTLECQKSLLHKKLVIVNGEYKTSLHDFLDMTVEELSAVIDTTILNKLIKDKAINVGKGLPHFCDLNTSFADTCEVIDKGQLAEALLRSDNDTHFFITCSTNVKDKVELLKSLKISNTKVVTKLKNNIFLTVGQTADDNGRQWKEQCRVYHNKTIYWIQDTPQKIQCNKVYNPDFYIKRRFVMHFNSIVSYIRNQTKSNDLFIVSYTELDKDEVSEMQHLYENDFLIVLKELQAQKYFKDFVTYFKSVHWFKAHNKQKLVWHCSSGLLDTLPDHIKLSGAYEESFINLDDRIVIIAGDPGMGKSTTLTSLAQQMKSHWVIYQDLRYCGHALADLASVTAITEDHAVNFISNASMESDLPKELLKCGLLGKTKQRVYVLIDGFDEINESVAEAFVKLLQFLKDCCKCHVWITARTRSKIYLENKLLVVAVNLSEIGRDEQQELLAKFWNVQLPFKFSKKCEIRRKLRVYAGKLLHKAGQIFGHEKSCILSVPLQLRMIAEAFPPSRQQLANLECGDFEIDVEDKADLYQTFIRRKYDIYFDEKVQFASSSSNAARKWCTETLMKKHSFLAYRMLFPNEADKHLDNYSEKDCASDVKDLNIVGLIQSECSDANYAFIHRTFAEYFVAALLIEWLNKPNGPYLPIEKFLMSPILNEHSCKGIRSFLNSMLTKSLIQEDDLMELYTQHIETLFSQNKRQHFVSTCSSVLHLAAAENLGKIIDILFACFKMFPEELEKMISSCNCDGNTALFVAKLQNNGDVMKQLLEMVKYCSAGIQQDLLWGTFYRSDANTDPVMQDMVSIAERYPELKDILREIQMNYRRIPDFLNAASYGDVAEMGKILHDKGKEDTGSFRKYIISSANRNNKTALHLAAMQGNLEAVNWLLNKGANANAKDRWGLTPLHVAAEMGNSEFLDGHHRKVVEVLLEKGADINAHDQSGRTALNLTKNKGIQQLLLNNTIDESPIEESHSTDGNPIVPESNDEEQNGKDLLALVAEEGKWQLVMHMIKHGADIKKLTGRDVTNLLKHITGRLETDDSIGGEVPSAIGSIITLNNVDLLDIVLKELAKFHDDKEHELYVEVAKLSDRMKERLGSSPFSIHNHAANALRLRVKLQF